MPPSRKPKALEPLAVQRGDVVLALFGKHQWLPALVSETTDCSAPTVLIEFFGDHAVGQQPRAKLRPFADLETMSSRSQPQSAAHGRAVAEARRGGAAGAISRCAPALYVKIAQTLNDIYMFIYMC